MAQCKGCIHFGICQKGFPWADGKGGGWCEDFLTSDVAPRAEVERLERILNSYALQYGTVRDKQKVIDEAKSEVASEIFEEIDRMCIDTFGNFNHRVFAELKKKYTEENG